MIPWLVAAVAVVFALVVAMLCASQRSEIIYLRGQVNAKQSHERRIERKEAGLPELEVKAQEPDLATPGMQARIDEAVGAWSGATTQEQKRADIREWRREGRDWPWIVAELERDLLDG